MVFSSLIFLFAFLPLALSGYYLINPKFRNYFLFVASLIFFAWGGVSYSFLLLFSISFNYLLGRGIAYKKSKKLYLGIGVALNVIFIAIFKYAGLITETLNSIINISSLPTLPVPHIILPIGISFYTFQAISYLIDIYRNEAKVQRNFANLGLFISLFPQLIAGPIVRYHDIDKQINSREHTDDKFKDGIMRFVLGLAKKVLIANNLALVADHVFSLPGGELSFLASWIGIIAYTFQIYYDFAGYSDMAIGLARMFGFELLENFNFPYISRSIQEFWRRWHISLSSWFRDYLYIPLGGNRKGIMRTYINLFIVFFITGLWHGSSWNFVIWGLVHGFFIIIERIGFNKILNKLPSLVSGIYTFLIALFAWVLFKADNFESAKSFYSAMLGFSSCKEIDINLILLLNNEFIISISIAIFGALGGFMYLKQKLNIIFTNKNTTHIRALANSLFIIITLLLTTLYLTNNTYNPFIYFRF